MHLTFCFYPPKKAEFLLIGYQASKIQTEGKIVVATYGSEGLMFPSQENINMLSPCLHEERIHTLWYMLLMLSKGASVYYNSSVDADVVVLAVNVAHHV